MDGNFTGLDVNRAKQDIERFRDTCDKISSGVYTSYSELHNFLKFHWAAPKAVEFSSIYPNEYYSFLQDFADSSAHIVRGASAAANSLARANGLPASFDEYGINSGERVGLSEGIYLVDLSEQANGTTGMDVEGVKTQLDIFKSKVQKIIQLFDGIANGIAFYDPDGRMVGQYNRGISAFKDRFESFATRIVTDLTGYLETETDNILMAKEQATDYMRSA